MKIYLGYIRVSTKRQGEEGVSLPVQRQLIADYAKAHGLHIKTWFEERETAAKKGRPQFNALLSELKRGRADGVIMHKIDRSARNLRDWTDLIELQDNGIDLRFVQDGLDLNSRGGRLSANLQAVIAADYVKNLSDEAKKGLYGRIHQGIYPFGAPPGYRDMGGGGKVKIIDPVSGPLVRHAFELYATGEWSYARLVPELQGMGLKNRWGNPLDDNGFTRMFNNPFYVGLFRVNGKLYQGQHKRLIRNATFDAVQAVLRGRKPPHWTVKNKFLFRTSIRCARCAASLVGERQRQKHVYYRCHGRQCAGTCLNETTVAEAFLEAVCPLRFPAPILGDLRDLVADRASDLSDRRADRIRAAKLALAKCDERISRLTDALIDGLVDKATFDSRHTELIRERSRLAEAMETSPNQPSVETTISEFLERANTAYSLFQTSDPEERREIVKSLTSNMEARGKNLAITLRSPYFEMRNLVASVHCWESRDEVRIIFQKLYAILARAARATIAEEVPEVPRAFRCPH